MKTTVIPDPKIEPMTTLEVAGRLMGISRSTVYRLAKADRFPVRVWRFGDNLRINTAELLAYLNLEFPG